MFFRRKRKAPPPPPELLPGDVLRSADRRSHAVVVRVEHPGTERALFAETVAHVTRLGITGETQGHFPFAAAALSDADIIDHWDAKARPLCGPEWEEGYAIWREAALAGEAGVFTVPLEAVL